MMLHRWQIVFALLFTRARGTIFRLFLRLWTPVVQHIILFALP